VPGRRNTADAKYCRYAAKADDSCEEKHTFHQQLALSGLWVPPCSARKPLASAPRSKSGLLAPSLLRGHESAADAVTHLLMRDGSAADSVQEGYPVVPW